ncbi:MAG: SUMF1/EgtB/PvdO family nonheme iron enzyme [bacterium]
MRWYLLFTFIIMLPCLALTGCKNSAAKDKQLVAQIPPEGGKVNPKDGAAMVLIPAGEFLMGMSEADIADFKKKHPNVKPSEFESETPQRKVMLDSYYIYQYEVTVRQYREFCQSTGIPMPKKPETRNFLRPWEWKDDNPIIGVRWYDALAYAEWAGAKLPTEAQWEKAARGTDGRKYPWGNTVEKNVYAENDFFTVWGHFGTRPVGYLPDKSPYGVFDMAGNACEWCADWYDKSYYKTAPDNNPPGPEEGKTRVVRGGSWIRDFNSCSNRRATRPSYTDMDIGFRCVMKVDQGL